MSILSKFTLSSESSQPPREPVSLLPRHKAQLALVTVATSILLFNLVTLSLARLYRRLNLKLRNSHKQIPGVSPSQDWMMEAPASTVLCIIANALTWTICCVTLPMLLVWWGVWMSHVSAVARNWAIAYGVGGIIVGLGGVHLVLVQNKSSGGVGFLMSVNTLLWPMVVGLAFGTVE